MSAKDIATLANQALTNLELVGADGRPIDMPTDGWLQRAASFLPSRSLFSSSWMDTLAPAISQAQALRSAITSGGSVDEIKMRIARCSSGGGDGGQAAAEDAMAADGEGNTPLLLAARSGRSEVVQLLVDECYVDAARERNARTGATALHEALRWNQMGAARLLMARGADCTARDGEGKTALDCAGFAVRDDPSLAAEFGGAAATGGSGGGGGGGDPAAGSAAAAAAAAGGGARGAPGTPSRSGLRGAAAAAAAAADAAAGAGGGTAGPSANVMRPNDGLLSPATRQLGAQLSVLDSPSRRRATLNRRPSAARGFAIGSRSISISSISMDGSEGRAAAGSGAGGTADAAGGIGGSSSSSGGGGGGGGGGGSTAALEAETADLALSVLTAARLTAAAAPELCANAKNDALKKIFDLGGCTLAARSLDHAKALARLATDFDWGIAAAAGGDAAASATAAAAAAAAATPFCDTSGVPPLTLLLEGRKANYAAREGYGYSPLHLSAQARNPESCRLLVALACAAGGAEAAQRLLWARDLRGRTALHVAAAVHSPAACAVLMGMMAGGHGAADPTASAALVAAAAALRRPVQAAEDSVAAFAAQHGYKRHQKEYKAKVAEVGGAVWQQGLFPAPDTSDVAGRVLPVGRAAPVDLAGLTPAAVCALASLNTLVEPRELRAPNKKQCEGILHGMGDWAVSPLKSARGARHGILQQQGGAAGGSPGGTPLLRRLAAAAVTSAATATAVTTAAAAAGGSAGAAARGDDAAAERRAQTVEKAAEDAAAVVVKLLEGGAAAATAAAAAAAAAPSHSAEGGGGGAGGGGAAPMGTAGGAQLHGGTVERGGAVLAVLPSSSPSATAAAAAAAAPPGAAAAAAAAASAAGLQLACGWAQLPGWRVKMEVLTSDISVFC